MININDEVIIKEVWSDNKRYTRHVGCTGIVKGVFEEYYRVMTSGFGVHVELICSEVEKVYQDDDLPDELFKI